MTNELEEEAKGAGEHLSRSATYDRKGSEETRWLYAGCQAPLGRRHAKDRAAYPN